MGDEKVTLVVATHKEYRMPDDSMYMPMMLGAVNRDECFGYARDDESEDNISFKNNEYCELTALYEIWKGVDADYAGLVQYRRLFANQNFSTVKNIMLKSENERYKYVLTRADLDKLIPEALVIVPSKRNYYVESLYSHYAHTHEAAHLDVTREVIAKITPSYLKSFDRVMDMRSGYMFNMMIMRKDLLDSYCKWLFAVLFRVEKILKKRGIVDSNTMSDFDMRLYGRISELLFNVWLDKKVRVGMIPKSRIKEIPFLYTESVDIKRKAKSFISAKVFGKKYEASF